MTKPANRSSWVPASPCGSATPWCGPRSSMSRWTSTPPAPSASTTWWPSASKSRCLSCTSSTVHEKLFHRIPFQTWGGSEREEHREMDPADVRLLHRPRQHCKSPAGGWRECQRDHCQRVDPPDACGELWEREHRILPAAGAERPHTAPAWHQ